mmetsp:Transcript_6395/g.15501  ORF Transcript_6395/g.15501 Transcript_6395/m.15501 type:complete len:335 (-) Transcript_6395:296-1300(-)
MLGTASTPCPLRDSWGMPSPSTYTKRGARLTRKRSKNTMLDCHRNLNQSATPSPRAPRENSPLVRGQGLLVSLFHGRALALWTLAFSVHGGTHKMPCETPSEYRKDTVREPFGALDDFAEFGWSTRSTTSSPLASTVGSAAMAAISTTISPRKSSEPILSLSHTSRRMVVPCSRSSSESSNSSSHRGLTVSHRTDVSIVTSSSPALSTKARTNGSDLPVKSAARRPSARCTRTNIRSSGAMLSPSGSGASHTPLSRMLYTEPPTLCLDLVSGPRLSLSPEEWRVILGPSPEARTGTAIGRASGEPAVEAARGTETWAGEASTVAPSSSTWSSTV